MSLTKEIKKRLMVPRSRTERQVSVDFSMTSEDVVLVEADIVAIAAAETNSWKLLIATSSHQQLVSNFCFYFKV